MVCVYSSRLVDWFRCVVIILPIILIHNLLIIRLLSILVMSYSYIIMSSPSTECISLSDLILIPLHFTCDLTFALFTRR